MKKGKCIISGVETNHTFEGVFVSKEVLDFARRYRDALSRSSQRRRILRGILSAFQEMSRTFGHSFEAIQKKLIAEMKEKGIDF